MGERAGAAQALALGHGLHWAATGAWPLVHMPSFEAITGRKRERWLVRTVGVLVLAVGVTLRRRRAGAAAEASGRPRGAGAEGAR